MIYPLLSEYIEAILSPQDSFDELKDLKPVLDESGRPIMSSGNFAVVFKMEDPSRKHYALKCFLREQDGRAESYKLIADQLDYVDDCPYFLKVRYLEKELFVDTSTSEETEFPVLIMDWVEGKTLDKYIREQQSSKFRLAYLAYRFSVLANWLSKMPFAHGDLKPDNIIVKEDGQIVLVDYDGMFIDDMKGQEAREIGSPDFRHPGRTSKQFDEHIDDFPLTSILLSLKLISLKPELLDSFGAQDRLLFSANDYQNPDSCQLFKEQGFYDYESSSLLWILLNNLKKGELIDGIEVLKNPVMDSNYAKVSQKDLDEAWVDSYGVLYSSDRLRLLKAADNLDNYEILEGTLCICSYAFSGCKNLKTIQFPNTIDRIGTCAFEECSSLEQVSIPHGLERIEYGTFERCKNLVQVYMPSENLKEIDSKAFKYCSSIIEISIPDSVEIIARETFQDCTNLSFVRLPSSLRSIGSHAFKGCKSLISIAIPKVETVYNGAFEDCSSLQSVYLPDSVWSIKDESFRGCSSLTTLRLPRKVSISSSALSGCTSLTTVYGDGIQLGAPFLVFDGILFVINKLITSFEVPESVTEIPAEAFSCCKALKSVFLHDRIKTIGKKAFSNCESLEQVVIPASVTQIDDLAFEGCKSLKIVRILGAIQDIAYGTFYGCESLTDIQLPKSLKRIGVTHSDYEPGLYDFRIIRGVFSGCKSLQTISIPDSVTEIPNVAFSDCEALKSIRLGNGIATIGIEAFSNCVSLESIVIPTSVNTIGNYAFKGCKSLKSVSIFGRVDEIQNGTFCGCESLIEIQLPDGLETIGELHIEDEYGANYDYQITGVFHGCKSLRTVSIPRSVTSLGAGTFQECESLDDVRLPEGLKYVGDYAFCRCKSLRSINLPESVLSIGSACFYECDALMKVVIHSNTLSIGYRPFESCYSLESFVSEYSRDNKSLIIDGVLEAFAPKDVLDYHIPDGVTKISPYVFYDCELLEQVHLPDSVREIGYAAFADCAHLSAINIPESVSIIGDSAFDNCPCEKSLVFPDGIDYKSDPYRWLSEAQEHQYRI